MKVQVQMLCAGTELACARRKGCACMCMSLRSRLSVHESWPQLVAWGNLLLIFGRTLHSHLLWGPNKLAQGWFLRIVSG